MHSRTPLILGLLALSLVTLIARAGETNDSKESPVSGIIPLEIKPVIIPPTGYSPSVPNAASKEGKALYERMNCAQCHSVSSVGGVTGPPLDGIGGRRSADYIAAHLTDPATHKQRFPHLHNAGLLMPHPFATPDEVNALTAYLTTLPEPKAGFLITPHPASTGPGPTIKTPTARVGDASAGRQAFLDHGCAACHSIGNGGSTFAPALDGIGKRLGRAQIESKITARGKLGAGMQWRGVNEDDARKITDYLLSLPVQ